MLSQRLYVDMCQSRERNVYTCWGYGDLHYNHNTDVSRKGLLRFIR